MAPTFFGPYKGSLAYWHKIADVALDSLFCFVLHLPNECTAVSLTVTTRTFVHFTNCFFAGVMHNSTQSVNLVSLNKKAGLLYKISHCTGSYTH